jgi:hypothetical protein
MNIIRNDKLIRRNKLIGQITSAGGFIGVFGGTFISLRNLLTGGNTTAITSSFEQDIMLIAYPALIVGFILVQIGFYFKNRWGTQPRPDELIDQALKGLDSKYTIYHYAAPTSHLLLGPSGVWVLLPYYQQGTISYAKKRWQQRNTSLFYGYLKIFGQESLGRPDLEVSAEIQSLKDFLNKHLPEDKVPSIDAALVFTHPKVIIDINEAETPPAETIAIAKLKDAVRKSAKTRHLSDEKIKLIQDALSEA